MQKMLKFNNNIIKLYNRMVFQFFLLELICYYIVEVQHL